MAYAFSQSKLIKIDQDFVGPQIVPQNQRQHGELHEKWSKYIRRSATFSKKLERTNIFSEKPSDLRI